MWRVSISWWKHGTGASTRAVAGSSGPSPMSESERRGSVASASGESGATCSSWSALASATTSARRASSMPARTSARRATSAPVPAPSSVGTTSTQQAYAFRHTALSSRRSK